MRKLPPLILALLLISCNVEDLDVNNLQGPTINGIVALPIGYVDYTMRELIDEVEDSELNIEEDSTSLLHLIYFDTATFNNAEDIVSIQDNANSAFISLPEVPPVTEAFQLVIDTVYSFSYPAENGEQLDSIFYNTGILEFELVSNIGRDLNYDVSIDNTVNINTGQTINFSGSLPGLQSVNEGRSLENHKTELRFLNGINTYEIGVRLVIFLNPGESLNAGANVVLNVTYIDQSFKIMYGQFGQDSLDVGNEILKIKFFNDIGESGFKFGNPEFTFDFNNSFGLSLGILFGGLYGVEETARGVNDTIYLGGSVTETPQLITAANSPGSSESSVIAINNQNSTLQSLLGVSPKSMGFKLIALANPEEVSGNNYVQDSSRLTTYITVTLPLELSLVDLERKINFDLAKVPNEIEEATLRLVTENELPFSAKAIIEIINEGDSISGDSVIYAVPENFLFETPFFNNNGIVQTPRKYVADIPLDVEGVNALKEGDKIVLRIILNSPRGGREVFVKVLADYSFKAQISVLAKLNYQL